MAASAHRILSAALVLTCTSLVLVATAPTASAHDTCREQTATVGIMTRVLHAVNVFAPFLPVELEGCDGTSSVDVKIERDFVGEVAPIATRDTRPNAPRTYGPCVRGMSAGTFPCDGVDMLSHVSHAELGTTYVNDVWGWTDPRTRKDYVLVGAREGTVFVDLSIPLRPEVLGILPTASTQGGDLWRDIKVYRDHAFIVSEHTDHGLQVFDLTQLRDWDGTYTTYAETARYTGHGSAHNLAINTETGFAYSVGAGAHSSLGPTAFVDVDDGSAAAGRDSARGALFGPPPTALGPTGHLAIVDDGSAAPTLGCGPLVDFPADAIAVVDRGGCPFGQKIINAQQAGAAGVIVVNSVPGLISMGGGDPRITIPAVMISQTDGATLEAGLPASGGLAPNPDIVECGPGLHMIDVREPTEPAYAGCFRDIGYVHDTQCVVYRGPASELRGRELCFASNATSTSPGGEHRVAVVDVTDKENPVSLARVGYGVDGYSHQGWLTPDQRYFLHGDEFDELRLGLRTTTRVWDVQDPANPVLASVFTNDTTAIDHNLFTEGGRAYASNYTSGLRVYDTSDITGTGLREVGYFDLYPENDDPTYEAGTWSNYPYLRHRDVVAVSSIDRGLFILRVRGPRR